LANPEQQVVKFNHHKKARCVMKKLLISLVLILGSTFSIYAQKARTVIVTTEPNAVVWIDDVKRGATDSNGKLTMKFVATGTRKLRVRAMGFKEVSQSLLPTQSAVTVPLVKTTDEAELTFQEAEKASTIDRQQAIGLYQKAISLRPKYPEALVAMARVMSDAGDGEGALKAIANARKARPVYPEASAVEGRIYRNDGNEAKAVAAFKRAIKEGAGFQPEAHAGLGLLYREKAESFASEGDFESETANYQLAANELKIALAQLAGAEPVLYEQLGVTYEKMKKFKEAIAVYEEFIQMFPNSLEVETYRSYIVQARKQMAEQ
jgi:Flp pilus assembly protein TadD